MLRTLALTLTFALAPAGALADDLPATPVGLEIRAHDGRTVGEVDQIVRDSRGRIIAADVSGLEPPADAPRTSRALVASTDMDRLPAQREFDRVQQASSDGQRSR